MSTPSQPPRIRPGRVAAAVCGVLALVGVGTGAVLAGPALLEAYQDSRPAPVPALPTADPVASAAQEQVAAAGGARWSGSGPGSDASTSSGAFDVSDSCSFEYHSTVSDMSTISVDGQAATRFGDSGWTALPEGETPLDYVPVFLDLHSAGTPCTIVEDLSRATGGLVESEAAASVPAPAPDVKRYVGEVTPKRAEALSRYRSYQYIAASEGRAPSAGELYDATVPMDALVSASPVLVFDMDSSGAPSDIWLTGKAGSVLAHLHFEELGPQDIRYPAEVAPAPDLGDVIVN